MTESPLLKQNPSLFPEKARVLSGSWLKLVAIVTMLIDHLGVVLIREVNLG